MEHESHGLRMIRRADRCNANNNELKTGVEQQKQACPKEEAQTDDEERSQARSCEQLVQLRSRYLISKTPEELCFSVLTGQSARVFVPIGEAVERRVYRDFVH